MHKHENLVFNVNNVTCSWIQLLANYYAFLGFLAQAGPLASATIGQSARKTNKTYDILPRRPHICCVVAAGTFIVEIAQYVVASSTKLTKCLCAAINSKKSAEDDDDDDEEDDEEEEEEEEDKASRASRWPEHSFDLRALPKAVQVCLQSRNCPCTCTRTEASRAHHV